MLRFHSERNEIREKSESLIFSGECKACHGILYPIIASCKQISYYDHTIGPNEHTVRSDCITFSE